MSARGPKKRPAPSPRPPRDALRGTRGLDVLEAASRIMPELMAVVFEGFRQTSARVQAALPAGTSEAAADSVDQQVALCFGATLRQLWTTCGGEACAADPTAAGQALRLVIVQAILKAAGHTGEINKKDDACPPQPLPN